MAVTYGIDRTGSAGSGGSALAYPFDSLTDPNADRLVFWDDSAGDFNWLIAGSGLTLTNVTLAVNIDDTPQNGVTNNAISSNWAYDHEAASDPHPGYRLESADHTHQSTGAQGGQLDHGLALTGLTDDDHTQYALLAGRSSGQSLTGGTAASETLTLRGTSHATKGLLLLNDTGGDIQVGGAATASALRFMEPSGSGTNYTAFKAQAQAGNVTYILPAADATSSGYALKSDGAGNLSWGAAGGGGASADVAMSSHGFSVGNVLYHNGTTYALADADAAATAEVVGIVSAVADANNFTLALGGAVTGLSGLTAGTVYFLSGTPGALTATEPSTVGQISKPLLIAYSTTAGYFFNMRGTVVGTAASTLSVENFSGNASTTDFTLSSSPLENNTFVMVEGVYQQKNTYSISGTTLSFSTAPPSGTNNIEVVTVGAVNIGTPSDNTVSTAKIVDDAVTEAKVAPGATLALATEQASTSGSTIDFNNIPAGTNEIIIMLEGVSPAATGSELVLRLGDSGGIEATGYVGNYGYFYSAGAANTALSTGFNVPGVALAGDIYAGRFTLTRMNGSNKWQCSGQLTLTAASLYFYWVTGSKTLTGELDRVQLLWSAGTTFDAGNINIAYK